MFTEIKGKACKKEKAYYATRKADGQIFLRGCHNPSNPDGDKQRRHQIVFQKVRALVKDYVDNDTNNIKKRFAAQRGKHGSYLNIKTMAFAEIWKANYNTFLVQASQELAAEKVAEAQAKLDAEAAIRDADAQIAEAERQAQALLNGNGGNSGNSGNTDPNGSTSN